ncbi:MAG: hypothetical protein ACSHWS_13290 [Sulfitobacter sp.]
MKIEKSVLATGCLVLLSLTYSSAAYACAGVLFSDNSACCRFTLQGFQEEERISSMRAQAESIRDNAYRNKDSLSKKSYCDQLSESYGMFYFLNTDDFPTEGHSEAWIVCDHPTNQELAGGRWQDLEKLKDTTDEKRNIRAELKKSCE